MVEELDAEGVEEGAWITTRRDVFRRAGVLGMLLSVPAGLLEAGTARAKTKPPTVHVQPTPPAQVQGALTPAEYATLAAIAAQIVPTDASGPGAAEAGAAQYINLSLAGWPHVRDSLAATYAGTSVSTFLPVYQAGLAATDAYAQASQGAPFVALSPAQQDTVLANLQAGRATGNFIGAAEQAAGSATFFTNVRAHVLQGMLCDPYYGGNQGFIGWKWVGYPGVRMPVTAANQSLTPPPLNPVSAYSLTQFKAGPPTLRGAKTG
jgi:gluconate 2-dehydrogenase gamma chain